MWPDSSYAGKGGRAMRRQSLIISVGILALPGNTTRGDLIPRTPYPKPSSITRPAHPCELKLKFRDDLKVRAIGGALVSQTGGDLGAVEAVVD